MDSKKLISCPFTPASGEVVDDFFIGRDRIRRQIVNTVIQPSGSFCNFSIVGLPRIGKSSLLMKIYPQLNLRYRLLVSPHISLDVCKDSEDMWERIIKRIDKELKRRYRDTGEYKLFKDLLNEETDDSFYDFAYLEIYSRCLYESGFRVILRMDEFDKFSHIASAGVPGQLRTLVNSAESAIRVITASRRTIELIEQQTADSIQENVSNLAGVFMHTITLRPFDIYELEEYWDAVSRRIGSNVSTEYRESVETISGGHPCFLNLINYDIWTSSEGHEFLINHEKANINKELLIKIQDGFKKHIISDLINWNLLKSLYELTWGIPSKYTSLNENKLFKYGLIEPAEPAKINGPVKISISIYFTDWLKAFRYDMPFIDLWDEVERNLRKLVHYYCKEKYKGDTQKMCEDFIGKWKGRSENIIEQRIRGMKERAKKNCEKFPGISENFIDHSEPSDIPCVFLHNDWDWFEYVFGGELKDWKMKFNEMAAMRNIHKHNTESGISQLSIIKAKEYCQEAIDHMDVFFKKYPL